MDTKQGTYIDLFAGCGGLSLGLHNAGWKGVFAIERSSDAFKTLEYNLINKKNHFDWPDWLPKKQLDINQVLKAYKKQLLSLRGQIDLVAGGPPCQGFSNAGKRREDDVRNGLIRSYLTFIMYTRPKVLFFENVKGFTQKFKKNKAKGKVYSEYVLSILDRIGYDVKGRMIDFSKYGIPQKRTRFILVGIRKDIAEKKEINAKIFFNQLIANKSQFLLDKNLPQSPKLKDAISDLLKTNGVIPTKDEHRSSKFFSGKYTVAKSKYQRHLRKGCKDEVPNSHSYPNHKPETIKKFELFLQAKKGKNLSKETKKVLNISKHVIIPLAGNEFAPTITTLPDDYIHYCEPRILTVREYARIQSFPDWYHFQGKYTTGGKERTKEVPRYTQIGNAIPPLFGEQAGIVLKKLAL